MGALKAWIYTPIFKLFGPSVVSIRLPARRISMRYLGIWLLTCAKNLDSAMGGRLYPSLRYSPGICSPNQSGLGTDRPHAVF